MNNTKNKNIIKFSLIYIMLGMCMVERVCGMENKNVEFSEDMFEAFIEDISGKLFIQGLFPLFKLDKGGICGGLCCARPAKEWVLVGMNTNNEVKEKLFDILKTVVVCTENSPDEVLVTIPNVDANSLNNNMNFFLSFKNQDLFKLIKAVFMVDMSFFYFKKNINNNKWKVSSVLKNEI